MNTFYRAFHSAQEFSDAFHLATLYSMIRARVLFMVSAVLILAACAHDGPRDCLGVSEDGRDDCFLELGEVSLQPAACGQIVDVPTREKCYLHIAVATCQTDLCDRLGILYNPDGCIKQISLQEHCSDARDVSDEDNDILNWTQSDDETATDSTGVSEVVDVQQQRSIPVLTTVHPDDACAHLVADEQDRCYLDEAIATLDDTFCARIRGQRFAETDSNPPRDQCYARIAVALCDVTLCRNVTGGSQSLSADQCVTLVDVRC